jgi:putative membrane-bound dehydrogenase-like protein
MLTTQLRWLSAALAAITLVSIPNTSSLYAKNLRVLFLGDGGHHKPAEKADLIAPVLAAKGIDMVYTEKADDLNKANLGHFDALVVFANIDEIKPAQAEALLEYVAEGGGFVPLHCASFCFRNNDDVVKLMGGQFQRHGTGTFRTVLANTDHELLKNFSGFESWDETYIHTKHNPENRVVLEYRQQGEQADGNKQEPWTWVRTHGKGRVFYTAWGHDLRTWNHPGFQNLLERGIRWSANTPVAVVEPYNDPGLFTAPKMTEIPKNLKKFEYDDVGAKIPNYRPSERWGEQGENLSLMQRPVPAEESLKHYSVPEGFEIALFASEPQLGAKPIAMCWDARGRLAVCETVDYPNELALKAKGRDRIEICEDTDGDGKADKFTIFAENISIPTSILAWKDGFLVQTDGETIFLKDTDGDDKADVRKTIITGWNMGDTHGCVSNFQYGLDNWVWAMQGYNNSAPEFNGMKSTPFRQGFFRFKLSQDDVPKVEELEFVRSTDNNTWGIGISEEGIIFGSTANRNPSVYMPLANRYYERVYGMAAQQARRMAESHLFKPITDKIRQVDQHGGFTAGCGHAIYTARNYPKDWWNRTGFVCGPTGHLVGTFVITPNGSDFTSVLEFNLAASDDEWAAPIVAEVGPDGNVWIIDWYNYIVQHNPTPKGFQTGKGAAYETDLRDKTHGRIFRLVYRGDKKAAEVAYHPPKIAKASVAQLITDLKSPTMLVRKLAQQALIEGKHVEAKNELFALLADKSVDEIGLNTAAIHAIWTLDGLGLISPDNSDVSSALVSATQHPSAGVRRNAYLALVKSPEALTDAITGFDWSKESNGQVKLAVLQGAADVPANKAVGDKLAAWTTTKGLVMDRWQRDAATSACANNALYFLQALLKDTQSSDEKAAIALGQYRDLIQLVSRNLVRNPQQAQAMDSVLVELTKANGDLKGLVLSGFVEGWPRNQTASLQPATVTELKALFKESDAPTRSALVRLAGAMGSSMFDDYLGDMIASYMEILTNDSGSVEQRLSAARDMIQLQPLSDKVVADVVGQINPRMNPDLARGLIEALDKSRADSVPSILIERQTSFSPALRARAIDVLLKRSEAIAGLLDAFEKRQLSPSDLSIEQKQVLSNIPDRQLRQRAVTMLKAGGGLPNPDRAKVIEEFHSITETKGDAKAGLVLFNTHCAKCHQHGDLGVAIGPNLTGMAVHPKEELLIHILDPNRDVEGNFRTYTILDQDGRVFTGMLASESRTTLEVIDNAGKTQVIQRDQIEELVQSRQSLMPEGFEKSMNKQELTDLLEFLTKKGQYLPLDMRLASTISTHHDMFFKNDSVSGALIFDSWKTFMFKKIPFNLIDPQGGEARNAIMLQGSNGEVAPTMPRNVEMKVGAPAKTIHILGGISGWGYPATGGKETVMVVRIIYADGSTEDHPLQNGVHISDYIRRIDVPGSEFAAELKKGAQMRYLSIQPKKTDVITKLEFRKASGPSCPIVMAVTLEMNQ